MLVIFLGALLIAVLMAVASVYSDLKARDRRNDVPPQGPSEGVWPPPPTGGVRP